MNPYVLKTRSIILVLAVLILTVFTSGCNKTTGPETAEPLEIKWQQTSLDTEALAVFADKSSGIVFANRAGAKLLRSLDQGKTWTISLEKIDVTDMAFRENGDIFAFNNCYLGAFVVQSSNEGETWNRFVAHNQPAHCPKGLVFHQSGYMFLGDLGALEIHEGGIYRSSDDGITWQETSFPDTIGVYSLASNNKGDVFAGTVGVYRSTDNGDSWSPVNEGIAEVNGRPSSITQLAINPVNNNIFAVTRYDKVYISTDNGSSWTKTGLGLQIYPSDIFDLVVNSKGEIFVAVLDNTNRPELLSGVFYSTDNGDSWQQVNNGLSNTKIFFSLAIDSVGFLYVATKDGVFRTVESTTK